VNLHAPPEKINALSGEAAAHPQPIEPTHYAWCSYELIGTVQAVAAGKSFWTDFIDLIPNEADKPLYGVGLGVHDIFAVRSPDGLTIYVFPILTNIWWRGRC
jgi:hypothetical protein